MALTVTPKAQLLGLFIWLWTCCASANHGLDVVFWESAISNRISQSVVLETYQDSSGAIWLATQEGLNRFDGKRVEIYRSNILEESGLAAGTILGIREDRQGNIWVATKTALQKFNQSARSFSTPATFSIQEKSITAFDIDTNDRIWLAIDGEIAIFNTVSEQLFNFGLPASHFGAARVISDLVTTASGQQFIAV